MELTLFESSIDTHGQGGVFVLYVPAENCNHEEHIDRIISALHVQVADRQGIRDSYHDFVAGLPLGHFVKFNANLVSKDKDISLRSSGDMHVSDHTKVLKFTNVEMWDPSGSVPSLVELIQHFGLPSLSTVMHPPAYLPPQNIEIAAPVGAALVGY